MTRITARGLLFCLSLAAGTASAQEVDDVIIAPADPAPPTPTTIDPNRPHVPPGGVPTVGLPEQAPTPRQPLRQEPPPPPPLPTPSYSVELQLRSAFPVESSFDQVMSEFGYDGVRIEPVGYVGVAVPTLEWLWLGARYGMRGRNWTHPDRPSAVVAAGDLLGTAQVRFALGRVVELGVLFGGGAGVVVLQLNGISADQVVPRFLIEGTVAFRIGANFAFGPRIGWDYFQWEGMNRYGHGLDIGGPFVGIGLEGRE